MNRKVLQSLQRGLQNNNQITEFVEIISQFYTGESGGLSRMAEELVQKARMLEEEDKLEEAIEVYTQIERKAEEIKNIELASQMHIEKGLVLTRMGRHNEAAELYKKALENYEKLGDESGIADSAYNLCIALSNMGENKEAIKNGERALKIYQKHKMPEYVVDTTYALGLAYLGEQSEKGIELLNQAFKDYRKLKNEEALASVLLDLGNAQMDLENPDEALEYYKKALKKFGELNDNISYADTLVCMAEILEEKEQPVKAADNYVKAIEIYVKEDLKETAEDYIKRVENMLWDLSKTSRRRIRNLLDDLKDNL